MINDVSKLTETDIRYIHAVFDSWIDKEMLIRSANSIELTLESYGVDVNVIEANHSYDEIRFVIIINGKSNFDTINKLRRELALCLAAPNGRVIVERTRNPLLVELILYWFGGHQITEEFNYPCKPIGIIRKFFALRYLKQARLYYQKARKANKHSQFLLNIKELRTRPFGWQSSNLSYQ